jgi:hypothetical protein
VPAAVEEGAGTLLDLERCADHDFHPGDDADRSVAMTFELVAGGGHGVEVVDQDAGVEHRCRHIPGGNR